MHKRNFGLFFRESISIFPPLHSFRSQVCCPPYRMALWLSTFPWNDKFNLQRVVGKKQNCQWIFPQNVSILCVILSGVKIFLFFRRRKFLLPPPPPPLLRSLPCYLSLTIVLSAHTLFSRSWNKRCPMYGWPKTVVDTGFLFQIIRSPISCGLLR